MMRKASIKETGEELSQAEWERFDAAVAEVQSERPSGERRGERPKGVRSEELGTSREQDPRGETKE